MEMVAWSVMLRRPAGAARHHVDDRRFRNVPKCRFGWKVEMRGPAADMGGGIPRPPFRRPRPAASLRSLRAALENASRFLSSAPLRVRIPPHAHEKALQVHKSLERYVLWGWDGGIRTPNSRHQKPEFYR